MSRRIVPVALAMSLIGNAVLAYALWHTHKTTIPKVRRTGWRACPKIAMQHVLYERATEHARRAGKKLVVVGNPTGGWVNKVVTVYGCGDICIDIHGCSPCEGGARILKMDATKALATLPDDSAVVFESGVFELVDDMDATVKELNRITGGDISRIYAIHDINFDVWPYHTRGIRPPAPTPKELERRRKNRMGYAKTGEGLARRIIYRFPPRDPYAWTEL